MEEAGDPNSQPAPSPDDAQRPGEDVTQLLAAASGGDRGAASELLNVVYDQLRAIAQAHMNSERKGHTLQATALVHEAYVRLIGKDGKDWQGSAHFYRAAADAMRKILIDHARARNTAKRGGGKSALHIGSVLDVANLSEPEGIVSLDGAIERLAEVDARAAEIVRLRFYAGLSEEAIAEALELSVRTVRREWVFARAWLRDALEREQA